MWHISPVADKDAEGPLRELYDQDLKTEGYVTNKTRVWSYRPELAASWLPVLKAIRSHMRLRAYELITIAASRAIGCVYCMLAHGAVLRKNGFTAQQLIAILEDYHDADLTSAEIWRMDFRSACRQTTVISPPSNETATPMLTNFLNTNSFAAMSIDELNFGNTLSAVATTFTAIAVTVRLPPAASTCLAYRFRR